MVRLYSREEAAVLKEGGKILSEAFAFLKQRAIPGVSLERLDSALFDFLDEQGALPSFLGYHHFPSSCCTSINETVLHGIPSPKLLADSDIFKLDIGVRFKGLCTDRADTIIIGTPSELTLRLKDCAEKALEAGIKTCRPGARLGDIGYAIEQTIKGFGFSLIEGYTGHGVGKEVHEEPSIPNHGTAGTGIELKPGMVIALEPMIAAGKGKVVVANDGWAVSTRDGSLTAHAEHTLLITDTSCEILTL